MTRSRARTMLLILGKEEDVLADAVCRAAKRAGAGVVTCGEPKMTERDQHNPSLAVVSCGGVRLQPDDVTGVLFRLPPAWWRRDSSTEDHHLIGAWYTLLWDLPCPVVNRLGLSWWFDQSGYSVQLSLHLNAAVPGTRLIPGGETSAATVYMAGSSLIPASPDSEEAARRLHGYAAALDQWQNETGVALARLSFGSDRTAPVMMDPCPDFAAESADVTGQVAEAVYSTLTRRG
jgi:hypothetical protein